MRTTASTWVSAASALVACAAVGLAEPADARRVREPPPLKVESGSAVVTAKLGSFCWRQNERYMACATLELPRKRKELSVRRGGSVTIRARRPLERVVVRTVKSDREFAVASPASADRRSWSFRVPQRAGRRRNVLLDVDYGVPGHALYGVRLAVPSAAAAARS